MIKYYFLNLSTVIWLTDSFLTCNLEIPCSISTKLGSKGIWAGASKWTQWKT